MKSIETATKKQPVNHTAENHKDVENHKKAANHFEAAAKSHHEAAKHHENGHHDKAAQSTVEAHGHATLAHEAEKEDAKHHALKA